MEGRWNAGRWAGKVANLDYEKSEIYLMETEISARCAGSSREMRHL
jgi:hypothetical protein